ncbi:MAG: restriction endonuclease subunit S [Candidatus Thiodiazotropha taylori]
MKSRHPKGWANVPLGDVAIWGSGGTPSRKNREYYTGEIPWVKTGDLGPKLLTSASEFITEEAVRSSSAKYFPKGSVAIAMYGATIGKTSILGIDATTNQACAVGQPIPECTSTEFLYYLLRNEKDNFIAKGKGGAQPNISQTLIKDHSVLFPPLAEQKQIAAKLDELLAQLDTLKTRLDAIPVILKRFRQSVLAAAVSGRLTEEWRAETQEYGKLLSKPGKTTCTDLEDIFNSTKTHDIPDQWKWFRLAELGSITGGGTPKKSQDEFWRGDIPWVTPKDMKIQKISSSQLKITKLGLAKSSTKLIRKSSILFVVRGMILAHSFPVALTEAEVTINQDMKAISLNDGVLSDFLLRALEAKRSIFVQLAGSSTHGTKRLETRKYSNVAIPVGSVEEQTEIVRRVEQLFTFVDQIEQRVKAAQSRVNHLTQSILAKAFRGELTTEWREQNPDLISGENSAEALLQRIKIERTKVKPVKPARRSANA